MADPIVSSALESGHFQLASGYCVWQYTNGKWALKTSRCAPGYVPGGPPQEKGKFEGENRRKACEPSPATKAQQYPPGAKP